MPAISSICGCSSPAGRLWTHGAMYSGKSGTIGSRSNPGLTDWSVCVVPGYTAPSPVSSNVAPMLLGSKFAMTHESVAVSHGSKVGPPMFFKVSAASESGQPKGSLPPRPMSSPNGRTPML